MCVMSALHVLDGDECMSVINNEKLLSTAESTHILSVKSLSLLFLATSLYKLTDSCL